MSTLRELVNRHARLSHGDVDHLQRLAVDWQLLADLSFADLLLWVPVEGGFLCVAQVRPTTAPTAYLNDQVGRVVTGPAAVPLRIAATEARIWREGDPVWQDDVPSRHEAIPVVREGRAFAVVARDTNLAATRVPSRLELAYLHTSDDLCRMIAFGTFPPPARKGETTSAPRVGDGFIRVGLDGRVEYASPNAQSAYRRLGMRGDLVGSNLGAVTRSLIADVMEGSEAAQRIAVALAGGVAGRKEVEAHEATMLIRALPLCPDGPPAGAMVLVRDVTELRRRDRQLLTKDATIREIHHRVKNNLQTVAALLRMQARRVSSDDARAALEESVRRVTSIAVVHETLSLSTDETVAFDTIVDRVCSMVSDVATAESHVVFRRHGSFGVIGADVATPLVVVLTELLQNAVEHAYGPGERGEVSVSVQRHGGMLRVSVRDNGCGLPEGFELSSSKRLGLQIVRTLVVSELGGSLSVAPAPGGGTEAVVDCAVQRRPKAAGGA